MGCEGRWIYGPFGGTTSRETSRGMMGMLTYDKGATAGMEVSRTLEEG